MKQIAATLLIFSVTGLESSQSPDCSQVCSALYSGSENEAAFKQCCTESSIGTEQKDEPVEHTHHRLRKNYWTDVSTSPDCDLAGFNECRYQYTQDWNFYKRWACVVASGCVNWSTFDQKDAPSSAKQKL